MTPVVFPRTSPPQPFKYCLTTSWCVVCRNFWLVLLVLRCKLGPCVCLFVVWCGGRSWFWNPFPTTVMFFVRFWGPGLFLVQMGCSPTDGYPNVYDTLVEFDKTCDDQDEIMEVCLLTTLTSISIWLMPLVHRLMFTFATKLYVCWASNHQVAVTLHR